MTDAVVKSHLNELSISALKGLLSLYCCDVSACIEKSDLIEVGVRNQLLATAVIETFGSQKLKKDPHPPLARAQFFCTVGQPDSPDSAASTSASSTDLPQKEKAGNHKDPDVRFAKKVPPEVGQSLRKLRIKDLKRLLKEHKHEVSANCLDKDDLVAACLRIPSLVERFKAPPDATAEALETQNNNDDKDEWDPKSGRHYTEKQMKNFGRDFSGKPPDAKTRVKISHLPKLPKDAAQRLKTLTDEGRNTLERQIFEAFTHMLEVNDQVGISNADLRGPRSFHATMDELRPQVEEQFKRADARFRIAKRVAAEQSENLRSCELVQAEMQLVEDAQYGIKAYKLMERLFAKVISRVLDTIDEEELRKVMRPEDISQGGQSVDVELPAVTRKPWFGAFQPLNKDDIAPLETPLGHNQEPQYAETLFVEMKELCERGHLCVGQLLEFESLMQKEKWSLHRASPCRERILRVAAFNRVVKSFNLSSAQEELQAHKLWKIGHAGLLFHPPDRPRVPEWYGQLQIDTKTFEKHAAQMQAVMAQCPPEILESHRAALRASQMLRAANSEPNPQETGCQSHMAEQDLNLADPVDDLVGICVSCIEKPALYVTQGCGHLVYCNSCRRKAVAKQLKDSGGFQVKSIKTCQLRNRELQRTQVRCPICREDGLLLPRDKYQGVIYE